MHFKDNQTLNLRVVDPIADEGVGRLSTMGITVVVMAKFGDKTLKQKSKCWAFDLSGCTERQLLFNGVETSTTSGKLNMPMAIRLQESDMVIHGCVHSLKIPDKTHPLLVSQACQAKLGMTKRVRDVSFSLDVYDAPSLEVARQLGTGLFMIRTDHLKYNDYVCNPLLNDLVIDFDDEPGVDSPARVSEQSHFPDCFTHAMDNDRGCGIPRNVLQADTIVASYGLAHFEQSSWSTHRRHEFWGTHGEPRTKKYQGKFVHSFMDNYPGICKDGSI